MRDDELDATRRRMELDQQRRPIEEKARNAQERGDLKAAATLWARARELALQSDEEMSRWYVEGQLADVLLKSGQVEQAKELLEASVAAGNDLPFADSLLTGICIQERRFEDAVRIRRDSWRRNSARAVRNGMPPIDPSAQIIDVAKWWKDTDSADPIALAEAWADEAQARTAWFAVRHERAMMLEKKNVAGALDLYLDLIRQGSKHDATYKRAMLLLEKAKRAEEALALCRSILGLGLSASVEEQARKRIAKLEEKAAKATAPPTTQAAKKPKALVPCFSIRSGEGTLKWLAQVEVKGGITSIFASADGAFAAGGTQPGLWWIAKGTDEPALVRAISKRSRLYRGAGAALITDDGTVTDGRARVELVGPDWTTTAAFDLPRVTSEVAIARWGVAVGCRAGGLYSFGWDGVARWRFDVPEAAEPSGFGRACPYLVSSSPDVDGVVFSSFTDIYALNEQGRIAWKWGLPAPPERSIGPFVTMQMPTASVSALQATRDGGAWVAAQSGELYRLNGRGQVTWSGSAGGNTSQLVTDHHDRLLGIAHSRGIALVDATGSLRTVVASQRWPRLTRSVDGRTYLVSEGKVLQVVDANGQVRAVVEFSRAIAETGFVGPHIVVAAGKLATFAVTASS